MITERRSKEKIINLECYTDGSLKKGFGKSTFGGWGFIVVQDGKEIYEADGSEYGTTNQRMELMAIRECLKHVSSIRRPHDRIVVYSDSAYAVNCYLQNWYDKWLYNGWINSKGETVANIDLWQDIIPYFDNFWYTFSKVKGHGDNFWNNKCDKIAQTAAANLKINWRGLDNG